MYSFIHVANLTVHRFSLFQDSDRLSLSFCYFRCDKYPSAATLEAALKANIGNQNGLLLLLLFFPFKNTLAAVPFQLESIISVTKRKKKEDFDV